jgi:predicted kinase
MSEVAFLTMDLDDRGRSDLARRVLNAYLEHTGDYDGLAVFRFYQVYRALVRAKVASIRLSQNGLSDAEKQKVRAEYLGYVRLAERYMQTSRAALIITHGLSGSGKSWLSQQLLESFDIIRIRSDIERKRLHGYAARERSGSGIDSGIYSAEAGRRTYTRLAELALVVLRAGHSVIADAAFLKRGQREQLLAVAEQARVPFVILDIRAPEPALRTRLSRRAQLNREASEADLTVLDHQLVTQEPLSADEQRYTLMVGTDPSPDIASLVHELRNRIDAT